MAVVGEAETGDAMQSIAEQVKAASGKPLSTEAWQEQSASLGRLLGEFDEACNEVNEHFGLTSAQIRILTYMKAHLGEIVDKHELRGVSMIFE